MKNTLIQHLLPLQHILPPRTSFLQNILVERASEFEGRIVTAFHR
jgi:hypothetical protein